MSEIVTLESIAENIASGLTPLRSNEMFWTNGVIYWLKTEQIGERYIFHTSELISLKALQETSIKLFPENSITIAMYGEGRTRGRVSILKEKMTTNQACCNIVLKKNLANYLYVYYYLRTQYDNIRSLSSGVRKNLNSKDIKEYKIPLPHILTQQKIASILSSLDDKIELNNKINDNLEQQAKLLYDYWFVQFEFPNEDGKPYKSSGGKMMYNKQLKREIPEGWEVDNIGSWLDNDKTGDWGKESEEGNYTLKVSCIRGADINGINGNGEVNCPERYILEKNSFKVLENNDIIIEISGGSPTQSTGRMAYITQEVQERFSNPLICSNFCKVVSLKKTENIYVFSQLWNMLYDNGVFFGFEGKTSGIKNLLFDALSKSYYTTIPNHEIVSLYNSTCNSIYIRIQNNINENQQLSSFRDWLLPMLMNGQIKVE